MKNWGIALSCLLLALADVAPAQTMKAMSEAEVKAAGGRQFQGAEIRQRNTGNTVYTMTLKAVSGMSAGSVFPIYHRDERVRVVRTATSKIESNWWVDGNAYCTEQRVVNLGNQCYTQWDLQGTVYSCLQPAGDCFFSSRLVPGNPENL